MKRMLEIIFVRFEYYKHSKIIFILELGPSVLEYFNDLNTLSLMVDTFSPYVDDWEVIGAEVPSGSSNEDIRRYIEYSKDMNAAFNWLQ